MMNQIFQKISSIKSRKTSSEIALAIDMKSGNLLELNDTGYEILNRLDGIKSVETICIELTEVYEVTMVDIKQDVLELLEKLLQTGFIFEVSQ